ncbi:hypothetical protein [Sorangium sp. So ce385]|uniref:hypothetical protein n=1 Tax=Sorangium sp. So ce385 TaxID=3133308 RepID=UPI003F5C6759
MERSTRGRALGGGRRRAAATDAAATSTMAEPAPEGQRTAAAQTETAPRAGTSDAELAEALTEVDARSMTSLAQSASRQAESQGPTYTYSETAPTAAGREHGGRARPRRCAARGREKKSRPVDPAGGRSSRQ